MGGTDLVPECPYGLCDVIRSSKTCFTLKGKSPSGGPTIRCVGACGDVQAMLRMQCTLEGEAARLSRRADPWGSGDYGRGHRVVPMVSLAARQSQVPAFELGWYQGRLERKVGRDGRVTASRRGTCPMAPSIEGAGKRSVEASGRRLPLAAGMCECTHRRVALAWVLSGTIT